MEKQLHQSHAKNVDDNIKTSLQTISQNIMVVAFGLLPLFFIPVAFAPFDYSKTLFIITAVLISCIFFSLSVLRTGSININAPLALVAFWVVAVVTLISSFLSGDIADSFMGDVVGVHTALFILLLAVIMSISSIFDYTKTTIMRLYILLMASAIILGVFHILRIIFGVDFMSMGVFTSLISSPIGAWNDLGVFFGLTILLSLITLEQLPLTKWGRILFSVVIGISLLMLAVVNFFVVWIVLALASLVKLMYTLTKDQFSEKPISSAEKNQVSTYSVVLSAVVFVVSVVFLIGGSTVGGAVSNITNISHIEVRPSLEATVNIGQQVYRGDPLFGIGPNRFSDAWRLHKDPVINQTMFWQTDFTNGHSFITTQFVTGGILSVFAWMIFFILFLIAGFRMLLKTVHVDKFWYFIGLSSFIAGVYLWGILFIYNPGSVIMLLTAMFTSIMFVSHGRLLLITQKRFTISSNKQSRFILMVVVMMIIVSSASAFYYISRHYTAMYIFSGAISGLDGSETLEEIEHSISRAYNIIPNDMFARHLAGSKLSRMNTLIGLQDPTTEQQTAFEAAATNGINAAQLSTNLDPTDPRNWSMLGEIYSILAFAEMEESKKRSLEAFATARTFDPTNPIYELLEAQLFLRSNDMEEARSSALSAIQIKPDYVDALFFLTQLDIAQDKLDDAIVTTHQIISIEPNNPMKHFHLGVLESGVGNIDNAITAFSNAVILNPNFSNARYFLALAFIQKGNADSAIEQLEIVLELNPDNIEIPDMIKKIKAGESINEATSSLFGEIKAPMSVITDEKEAIGVDDISDAPLISTINPTLDNFAEDTTEADTLQQ